MLHCKAGESTCNAEAATDEIVFCEVEPVPAVTLPSGELSQPEIAAIESFMDLARAGPDECLVKDESACSPAKFSGSPPRVAPAERNDSIRTASSRLAPSPCCQSDDLCCTSADGASDTVVSNEGLELCEQTLAATAAMGEQHLHRPSSTTPLHVLPPPSGTGDERCSLRRELREPCLAESLREGKDEHSGSWSLGASGSTPSHMAGRQTSGEQPVEEGSPRESQGGTELESSRTKVGPETEEAAPRVTMTTFLKFAKTDSEKAREAVSVARAGEAEKHTPHPKDMSKATEKQLSGASIH